MRLSTTLPWVEADIVLSAYGVWLEPTSESLGTPLAIDYDWITRIKDHGDQGSGLHDVEVFTPEGPFVQLRVSKSVIDGLVAAIQHHVPENSFDLVPPPDVTREQDGIPCWSRSGPESSWVASKLTIEDLGFSVQQLTPSTVPFSFSYSSILRFDRMGEVADDLMTVQVSATSCAPLQIRASETAIGQLMTAAYAPPAGTALGNRLSSGHQTSAARTDQSFRWSDPAAKVRVFALGGAACLVLGALAPWMSINAMIFGFSVSGIQWVGPWTLVVGLVVAGMFAWKPRDIAVFIAGRVLAMSTAGIAAYALIQVGRGFVDLATDSSADIGSLSVGVGLILTMIGCAAIIAGSEIGARSITPDRSNNDCLSAGIEHRRWKLATFAVPFFLCLIVFWITGGILPIGGWSEDDFNFDHESPFGDVDADSSDGTCDFDQFLQDPDCGSDSSDDDDNSESQFGDINSDPFDGTACDRDRFMQDPDC